MRVSEKKAGALWAALGLGVMGLAVLPPPATGQEAQRAEKLPAEVTAFFEAKIRPVLIENCIACHGKEAQLGGLRLDSREALLKGGDSGTALVPGDPEKSLLIQAVRHVGKIKMPQGGKLKDSEIAALSDWVRVGAPWPATPAARLNAATVARAGQNHWAFQPVKKQAIPAVKNRARVANPVDAFILSRLEARKLAPAPLADRRTLLRRVTYDLTGLPPTYAETRVFLADKSPDAYEKVVDRLLASPRYGERWARHWLDIARYADTKGYVFTEDRNYPNAYTYRDWVIRSLNADLPYDRFIQEQLAADLLPDVQQGEDKRPLAALGFLTVGRRFLNQRPDIIDDRIDTTMRGFQGLTVACARCHDHKFDPVPAQDYYSLYGVFNSSEENSPPISPRPISEPFMKHDAEVQAAEEKVSNIIVTQTKRLRKLAADPSQAGALSDAVKKALQSVQENEIPGGDHLKALEPAFEPDERRLLDETRTRLAELKKSYPPRPEFAMGMTDAQNCGNVRIFKRGNPGNPGEEAPRRFLLALSPAGRERPLWTKGSGRLELAKAIASPENPLTARVIVNRVWLHHFGAGIVRTPSDFGRQGEKPTHPELLDWLAGWFMENGWSLKKLHKLLVLSSTYRQNSVVASEMALKDPENRLWGRMNRHRLDLEQLRDSLLFASGKLDMKEVGGKSEDMWKEPYQGRRSVYGFIERQNLPQIFKTFDFASPDTTNAQRFRTTVPQQALFLMNSPFVLEQARQLVSLPEIADAGDEAKQVRRLYLRLFDRLPDPEELALGVAYLQQADPAPGERTVSPWKNGYGGYNPASGKVTFTSLPHFTGTAWQISDKFPDPGLGYILLSAEGGHPGNDSAHGVIRRWTAPASATLEIDGVLKHPNEQGDGVRVRLVSSRQGLLGEWTAHKGEVRVEKAGVRVKAGETLDFIVDPISGSAFDSFSYAPVIKGVEPGGRKLTWSASRDFSGPAAPPLPRPARYAQALLMTNEFLFVD